MLWSKFFSSGNNFFLGHNISCDQQFFWHKVFGTQNLFGPNIVCTQIKCWTNNFIHIKYLGPNFVWTKLFGLKTNLDQQFHPDQIVFWDKTFFRTKFSLWPKTILYPDWDILTWNVVWRIKGKLECGSAQLNFLVFLLFQKV